jgi:hypothetical protein
MIKVYENFDFSRVGQMQSLLESHGIGTFIRNQYGSSVMGEVPFVEVVPQLYVLRERDVGRARELLDDRAGDWVCPRCGIDVEGQFDRCWKCDLGKDEG